MHDKTHVYHFERLTAHRLSDLEWLHEAVYQKKLPEGYLAAKYDSAYAGPIFTGFLAYDQQGIPAAYYGVIPCFLAVSGKPFLAAQSADTMTHPDHQRKGLFFTLAKMTYSLCQKENIRLVFGFPNQNSTAGLLKLDWQKTGEIQRFTFPVSTVPLEKIARKAVFLKKLYRWYGDMILQKYRGLNEPFIKMSSPVNQIGLLRNDPYFEYKAYNKSWFITIDDATIWVKIQNGLIIGDIADFENHVEEIIRQLKKLCFTLGTAQLQFQVCTKTRLYQLLKQYAEPEISFPVMIKDLGCGLDISRIQFSFADIDIF